MPFRTIPRILRFLLIISLDDTVDPGTEYTLGYIKSSIKDFVHSTIGDQLDPCFHRDSGNSFHYIGASQSFPCTFERHNAPQDRVAVRLRLDYKYFWKVTYSPPIFCVLRNLLGGQILQHYVMECPLIAEFKPHGQH